MKAHFNSLLMVSPIFSGLGVPLVKIPILFHPSLGSNSFPVAVLALYPYPPSSSNSEPGIDSAELMPFLFKLSSNPWCAFFQFVPFRKIKATGIENRLSVSLFDTSILLGDALRLPEGRIRPRRSEMIFTKRTHNCVN